MPHLRRIALLTLVGVAFCTSAFPQCRAPKFKVGEVWEDSSTAVFEAVSIPLPDFAPTKLMCLAQSFKRRYGEKRDIDILIFSSREAAKAYSSTLGPADYAPPRNKKEATRLSRIFSRGQLHGLYSYKHEEGQEYVELTPFGDDRGGGPYDTRIDISAGQPPRCRLAIEGRCVLALDEPRYPEAALTKSVSGDISLSATISGKGGVTSIRVTKPTAISPEDAQILADAAVQNFRAWKFAGKPGRDVVQITYSYLVDPSLPVPVPYHRQVTAEIAPPRVVIRGRISE
jgi:TonB family protein